MFFLVGKKKLRRPEKSMLDVRNRLRKFEIKRRIPSEALLPFRLSSANGYFYPKKASL